jgi:hypothetical protein
MMGGGAAAAAYAAYEILTISPSGGNSSSN